MILSYVDRGELESCRDHEKDGGVAFLADILCKIIEYLEARAEVEDQ